MELEGGDLDELDDGGPRELDVLLACGTTELPRLKGPMLVVVILLSVELWMQI